METVDALIPEPDLKEELESARNVVPRLNSVQKEFWRYQYKEEEKQLSKALAMLKDEDREATEYVLKQYLCQLLRSFTGAIAIATPKNVPLHTL